MSVDLPNHNFGCPEGACVSPRASEGERRTEITKITKTYAQTKQKDGKQQKKKKKKNPSPRSVWLVVPSQAGFAPLLKASSPPFRAAAAPDFPAS